ncbi:MAG TPA: EAL domain-containing protein [Verrucomicrobiae bacterium]|nr:EAL domain-containing protein [Verrucomicrobiae bacterium]
MNVFRSVRFRLFALCVSLLAVMGGANLLLGQINQKHEEEVALLQEQYRRVNVIFSVQQAMVQVRFWQGQVNSSILVSNVSAEKLATQRLNEARAHLNQRFDEMKEFDATAASEITDLLGKLIERMREGVVAFAQGDPTAKSRISYASSLVTDMEGALTAATKRQQDLTETAQRVARKQAADSKKISIAIIVASGGFGLLLTTLVLNSIVRPMQTTINALRMLNAGETSVDLPPLGQDEFGDMAAALRQFRDQAERLRHLAFRDPLTGIGNRARLEEDLRRGLEICKANGTGLALLYVDVDNFRTVNDSLGHGAGDQYLREAVERLSRFAPSEALVCRYGGDKFTVLIEGLPAWDRDSLRSHLRAAAKAILLGMSEPFELSGELLPMSVSVGVAVYPVDGQSGEKLVSSADAAMYLAKRNGRNHMQFASPELTGDARRQLATTTDIRRGIDEREFEPYYQPIVDVTSRRVVGAEALLRWRHPQRGIVNAGEFMPAAEASGLIDTLGEQCILQASRQLTAWRGSSAIADLRISVNLSARQIEDRTVLQLIERVHADKDLAQDGLDFEITETAILAHVDRAQETLNEIRRLGHNLSVDDFGTGYSSLVYLQRFPINRIKIDRSFVARLGSTREAQAIIAATVALARSLDLEVVAEGVETEDQVRRLVALGCVLQQGYYFTPALQATAFESWCQQATIRLSAVS